MTDHSVLDEPHYSATWVSLEFTLTVPLRIIYTLISSDFSLDKKYSNFCKIKIMIIFTITETTNHDGYQVYFDQHLK